MFYLIYKVINITNNKFYIGYHSTKNINDSYLGSGKLLKLAIKKYGQESFKKEILFVFDNKESALLKEHELVNSEIVNDNNSYNLKIGGEGGWDYINDKIKNNLEFREEVYEKQKKAIQKAYASGKLDKAKKATSERNKRLWAEGKFKGSIEFWKDKKLSAKTRKKLSENSTSKLSEEEIERRKEIIKNSDTNFSKYGWVGKIAILLNMQPQKVNVFMKKYMSEFYENCFKRQ